MSAIRRLMFNMLRKAATDVEQKYTRIPVLKRTDWLQEASVSQTGRSRTLNTLTRGGEAEKILGKLLLAAVEAPLRGTSCWQVAEDAS